MFSTTGLFGQVPCPHLDHCLLPNCMFSHKAVVNLAPAPASVRPPASSSFVAERESKRRRIGDKSTDGVNNNTRSVSYIWFLRQIPTSLAHLCTRLLVYLDFPPIRGAVDMLTGWRALLDAAKSLNSSSNASLRCSRSIFSVSLSRISWARATAVHCSPWIQRIKTFLDFTRLSPLGKDLLVSELQ